MKVLIADKFDAHGVQALRGLGCTVTQEPALSGDALVAAVRDSGCEVLIVRSTVVDAAVLDAAAGLRLVIRAGSGYNTIDTEGARQRNVHVANTPGMNSVAVAELVMGLMLALDRRICHNVADLRRNTWNKQEYSKALGLKGRTLGIVGLGRIGYELAVRARAFAMTLVYSDVVDHPQMEAELGIGKVSFQDLLGTADFISLHVPLDDNTRHMIGAEQLAMMKPEAIVINCSRGGVIDHQALATALRQGRIRGAGLDVYEQEPGAHDRRIDDVVAAVDMVYGTHHIGASTAQAQSAVAEEVVRVVDEFIRNGRVLHCVN